MEDSQNPSNDKYMDQLLKLSEHVTTLANSERIIFPWTSVEEPYGVYNDLLAALKDQFPSTFRSYPKHPLTIYKDSSGIDFVRDDSMQLLLKNINSIQEALTAISVGNAASGSSPPNQSRELEEFKSPIFTHTKIEMNGTNNQLVVVLHGCGDDSKPADFSEVLALVRTTLPNAAILSPHFNGNWRSNLDPLSIANELENMLDIFYEHRPDGCFNKLILISHSAGGMLLRKAFLYGLGFTEDRRTSLGQQSPPRPWTAAVDRIVLLSGMNRGWFIDEKPPNMSRFTQKSLLLSKTMGRIFNRGKLIRDLERGTPFIANARVQWIKASLEERAAPVFQLMPEGENLISITDNRDIACSKNFIFISIPGTDHASILKVEDSTVLKERLTQALTLPVSTVKSKFKQDYPKELAAPQSVQKRHVVFVMHGIRDDGIWTEHFEKALKLKDPSIIVSSSSYGRFPILGFIVWRDRQKNVNWFMDRYCEEMALARDKDVKVSFIGHSNGTYIAASALKKYFTLKLDTIAFAGSVVPCDFPWRNYVSSGQVRRVRNDMAAKDMPVGFATKFFESAYRSGVKFDRWSDLGTGGFNGFDDHDNVWSVHWHNGGHSSAIDNLANVDSIAEFVVNGTKTEVAGIVAKKDSQVDTVSKYIFPIGATAITIVAGLLALIAVGSFGFTGEPWQLKIFNQFLMALSVLAGIVIVVFTAYF